MPTLFSAFVRLVADSPEGFVCAEERGGRDAGCVCTICGKWVKTAVVVVLVSLAGLAGCHEETVEQDASRGWFEKIAEIERDSRVPADISGLSQGMDGTYWAVCDSRGDLCRLDIRIDPENGIVSDCKLLELLHVPNGDDMEGLTTDPLRGSLWISDEAGPRIFEYRPDRRQLGEEIILPDSLRQTKKNRSLESVEITPDGLQLWTCNESARETDDPSPVERFLRIVRFSRKAGDASWQLAGEWLYRPEAASRRGRNGVASICSNVDGSLLVLEREKVSGNPALFIARLYEVDFSHATDMSRRAGLSDADCVPVAKRKVFEQRESRSMYEGICRGPVLVDGSQVFVLVSDGDGEAAETIMTLRRLAR